MDTLDVYRDMIAMLKQQRSEAQAREQAAQERERDYREHITPLTAMLDQAHQQNQRLLEAPRPAPLIAPVPSVRAAHEAPRGEMRQRIVVLLQQYPDGLSPAQTRQLLGIGKRLSDTMEAMARDGLLRRVEHGLYVVR
jgi:hypothetical protein